MREVLVWKDKADRVVGRKCVIGMFAAWAVRQSPYLQPEGLEKGINEFDLALKCEEFEMMTIEELEERIRVAIDASPQVVAWNSPKIGNPTFAVVTRYGGPPPDRDFIDLGALARNIKHGVWLELMYDDGCFEGARVPSGGVP